METIEEYEKGLTRYALGLLGEIEGVKILGPKKADERVGIISLTFAGIDPLDLATFLDTRGIAVRAGLHCAQPLHEKLGVASSLRISFGVYNTVDEIDGLIEALRDGIKRLSRDS